LKAFSEVISKPHSHTSPTRRGRARVGAEGNQAEILLGLEKSIIPRWTKD